MSTTSYPPSNTAWRQYPDTHHSAASCCRAAAATSALPESTDTQRECTHSSRSRPCSACGCMAGGCRAIAEQRTLLCTDSAAESIVLAVSRHTRIFSSTIINELLLRTCFDHISNNKPYALTFCYVSKYVIMKKRQATFS